MRGSTAPRVPTATCVALMLSALLGPSSPARAQDPNSFNRLMKAPSTRNAPPSEDGIHDPGNEGTPLLQSPREAFEQMPKSASGNFVDWVRSLLEKRILPRYDLRKENAEPPVMDLNIVREVKGSMPDVVYPHKAHTEWLDCSNCHPAIFLPQKGANQMSMAQIMLGEKCGVCHGRVAFPVSECRRCHSQTKPAAEKHSAIEQRDANRFIARSDTGRPAGVHDGAVVGRL